jgi:hypothetical protein
MPIARVGGRATESYWPLPTPISTYVSGTSDEVEALQPIPAGFPGHPQLGQTDVGLREFAVREIAVLQLGADLSSPSRRNASPNARWKLAGRSSPPCRLGAGQPGAGIGEQMQRLVLSMERDA